MAVSKRLRFEVLRRDNHACRYCGRSAPGVQLTVDHVVPVALGGGDDPTNLVAACRDCNGGKSSVPADSTMVDDVAQDALRWAKAMELAAAERAADRVRVEELHGQFVIEWESWTNGRGLTMPKPSSWSSTVDQFLNSGLSMSDLHELIAVAMESKANDIWRYFCGCCWRRIGQLQERVKEILEQDASPTPIAPLATVWTEQEINEWVDRAERVALRRLNAELIGSAHCRHRSDGESDCGDPVCRIQRAEILGWMSDQVILKSLRGDEVVEAAEALLDG